MWYGLLLPRSGLFLCSAQRGSRMPGAASAFFIVTRYRYSLGMVLVRVCSLCGRCVVWAPPGPLPPAPLPLALYALAGGGLYHLFVMVLRCWSVRSPSPLAARGVGAKPPLRGYRLGFPGSVDIGLYFFAIFLHCSPASIAALLAGENARICGHRRGCSDWVDIGLHFFGYALHIISGGRLGPWHCSPASIAALLAGENARICGHRRGCFDWVDSGLYLLAILIGLADLDRRAEKWRRAARLIVPSLPVFLPVARFLGLFG